MTGNTFARVKSVKRLSGFLRLLIKSYKFMSKADTQRAEWFARRRQELRGERWRVKLRSAVVITEARHSAANAREGGWCFQYFPPIDKLNSEL